LQDNAKPGDAAVVSLESACFGGLMASRLGQETTAEALNRLQVLDDLHKKDVRIYASTVVQRTPNMNDAGEEPEYWATHGNRLHDLSGALHKQVLGQVDTVDNSQVPAEYRQDFFRRRLRNHALNMAALDWASKDVLDHLVVSADDTAPFAVATAELNWVKNWVQWAELNDKVTCYPGADEVACVLIARVIVEELKRKPKVKTECPGAPMDLVAPYENVPIVQAVVQHVRAAGAEPISSTDTTNKPDLYLIVAPPRGPGTGDWAPFPPSTLQPAQIAVVDRVLQLVKDGNNVALADCAYPNGADPELLKTLHERGLSFSKLSGYAGWNTAGNTIGSCLGIGLADLVGQQLDATSSNPAEIAARQKAHDAVLARRVLEDWGYMTKVRTDVRRAIGSDPTRHDHLPKGSEASKKALDLIEKGLTQVLSDGLPGFQKDAWKLKPSSVFLNWDRTFECDFEIEPN
jgi:hypothetical protein